MTTLSTATRSDSLLRLAMRTDAVLSGLGGIVLIVAAGPLSGFTGLPKGIEYGIGAAFIVYAMVALLSSGVYTLVFADLQYLGVRRITG